jgi:hypothetical protein
MDLQLAFIFCLTFVIHLIATLAYSVRIAGTRTRKIAVSLALFNILVLVSRTSNSFQAPLLAKRVEHNLLAGVTTNAAADFQWLLAATTLATLLGGFLIPTFQRLFARGVVAFAEYRSLPRLMLHGVSRAGLSYVVHSFRLPAADNLRQLRRGGRLPASVLLFNILATAVATVGVFASLYAGYLEPQLRVTASNLSAIINGLATIAMFVFIDPYLSLLTDDVVEGRATEPFFRKAVVWLIGSRLAGTVLAQWLLLPAAQLIVTVARAL